MAVLISLRAFSMSMDVKNQNLVVENLQTAASISLICGIIIFINCYIVNRYSYSMSLGYLLLLPAIFFFNKMLKDVVSIFPFIISFLIILFCGSRGPLLSLAIYMLWNILLSETDTIIKRRTKILLLIFTMGIFIFYNRIVNAFVLASNEIGIYSRTISMIEANNVMRDSGRNAIYLLNWQKIKEKPIFGWGICGELSYSNVYPHNLFIELCVDYGLILGALIIGLFVFSLLRKLISTCFSDNAIITLMCLGFIPLVFSTSYLEYPFFWVLFGFCFPFRIVV